MSKSKNASIIVNKSGSDDVRRGVANAGDVSMKKNRTTSLIMENIVNSARKQDVCLKKLLGLMINSEERSVIGASMKTMTVMLFWA
jgi:hypothetical protein